MYNCKLYIVTVLKKKGSFAKENVSVCPHKLLGPGLELKLRIFSRDIAGFSYTFETVQGVKTDPFFQLWYGVSTIVGQIPTGHLTTISV